MSVESCRVVSCRVVRSGLAKLGVNLKDEEVGQLLDTVDGRRDGAINYSQFVRCVRRVP
jgi:Ca2+-binding EF-hand superfamily protein